jgi:hypothetical protein
MCDNKAYLAHMARSQAVDLDQKASGRRRTVERRKGETGALATVAAAAVEDALRAGLLEGERTEHVSFRAPRALVEAARRETGIQSTTELGIAALASLARPDPVAAFMKRARGRLAGLPKIEP